MEHAEIQSYLKRFAEIQLSEWRERLGRKPLVLRGPRQVGKTYLVQHWGATHFESVMTVNEGALAEQFVGQQLLCAGPAFEEPQLFYWAREARNANAEVDFVISRHQEIFPVEVKAGKTGTLRSLFQFLLEKHCPRAVRCHTGSLALEEVRLPGEDAGAQLLSVPLYAVGQLDRLLVEAFGKRGKP
jgi:hypothetical protein